MAFCSESPRIVEDVAARSRSLFEQRRESFDGGENVFDRRQKFFDISQPLVEQSQEFFDTSQHFNLPDSNVFDISQYAIDPRVSGFDLSRNVVARDRQGHGRVCCAFDKINQLLVKRVYRATPLFEADARTVHGYPK